MHLIYVDDSCEKPCQIYSAIAIPAERWWPCFEQIKRWRRSLRTSDGISLNKEFHATEFCGGRGRLGSQTVSKYRRSRIFREALLLLNGMDGVRIFSVCKDDHPEWALERLLTRINRTLESWNSYGVMIFDEGQEADITRLLRRLGVYNPVPVYIASGRTVLRNLKLDRILEDPVFKNSEHSYFIQMADFVAYALLRCEKPLPSKSRYGYHECFELLADCVVRVASPRDPMGVIR